MRLGIAVSVAHKEFIGRIVCFKKSKKRSSHLPFMIYINKMYKKYHLILSLFSIDERFIRDQINKMDKIVIK